MSMESFGDLMRRRREGEEADAARYAALDQDSCQLCEAHGPDMRSVVMRCFYAIEEVIPEAISLARVQAEGVLKDGYFLRVCKACRGDMLGTLADWRARGVARRGLPKDEDGYVEVDDPERCIPVRTYGAIEMLTREEWDARKGATR